jgi:hypothetical protein
VVGEGVVVLFSEGEEEGDKEAEDSLSGED